MSYATKRAAIRASMLIAAAAFCAATPARAVVYGLRAGTTSMTMPDGRVVPMCGFSMATSMKDLGVIQVPGPTLAVPPGDRLTIVLLNQLPEPVSLVIPGQTARMTPVRNQDGRIRSLTTETAPGAVGVYTWPNFKSGTFLYHSGSHPQIQVPLGLYGAVGTAQAYPGLSYDDQGVLFLSEIDPDLNDAVFAGEFGAGKAMPSSIDSRPLYGLINGRPYSGYLPLYAGQAGRRKLGRIINAGWNTHSLVFQGTRVVEVAEDGNAHAYPADRHAVLIAAQQTKDVLLEGPPRGTYPLYDRRLNLTNAGAAPGGMLTHLRVAPPLSFEAGPLAVARGERFSLNGQLHADIAGAFDFYMVLQTPTGFSSIGMNGALSPGIRPAISRQPGAKAPLVHWVWSDTAVPADMPPGAYTLYIAALRPGTPVARYGEGVIFFDQETVLVR